MRFVQILQILRLSRPPTPSQAPKQFESKIDQKLVSKQTDKSAKVVPTDSHSDPHGRPNSKKITQKVRPKCLSEKMITKSSNRDHSACPRTFKMMLPPKREHHFHYSPSFANVLPKWFRWHLFGTPLAIKIACNLPKEALKKSAKNRCDLKCHLDQTASQNDLKMT